MITEKMKIENEIKKIHLIVGISRSPNFMSQLQSFIQLVNTRLFDGKGEEQLRQLWTEVHESNRCQTIIRTGERMGQVCNKGCVKGQDTCMCHQTRARVKKEPVEEKERCGVIVSKGTCKRFRIEGHDMCKLHMEVVTTTCSFVLEKGKRKGIVCGKKTVKGKGQCSQHVCKIIEQEQVIEQEQIIQQERIDDQKMVVDPDMTQDEMPALEQEEIIIQKVKVEQEEELVSSVQPVVQEVQPMIQEVQPVVQHVQPVIQEVQPVVPEGCAFVLKSGIRVGQECSKKCVKESIFCSVHAKK